LSAFGRALTSAAGKKTKESPEVETTSVENCAGCQTNNTFRPVRFTNFEAQTAALPDVVLMTFAGRSAAGSAPRLASLPVDSTTHGLIEDVLSGVRVAGPLFKGSYRPLCCLSRGPGVFSLVCAPVIPGGPHAVCFCILKKKDLDGQWETDHKDVLLFKIRSFFTKKCSNLALFRWLHEDEDVLYAVSEIQKKNETWLLQQLEKIR
jgi:hypothetical protein